MYFLQGYVWVCVGESVTISRVMKSLKVTELPPLVYQLLVLSVKGHQATVLNGIRALFSYLDEQVLENSEPEEDR